MMRVLYDLDGQEEACVQAMRHTRPSSISLYHSSRVPIGLRILPTLTRISIPQAGFLHLFLCAPRLADDLLQRGQLLCGKLRDGFFDLGKRAHREQIAPRTPQ